LTVAAPEDKNLPTLSRPAAALAWVAIVMADLGSLYFFESRHLSNLYGDGIAHVEGARRIFDSLTPGYEAIGSVWLPLPHLLAAPLALNDVLWRTGLAGSLVSAVAFALTAWLLFRLSLEMNCTLAAAAVTLASLLLCLNLLYIATTPLTEPLAILWSVLTVFLLFRFQQSGKMTMLVGAALAAFLGTLTRYDGWYLLPFAALFILLCRTRPWKDRIGEALVFSLIAGTGPLLWLLHNAYRFHNPLEFYNGPYSAKAIYAHQLATTGFRYPTDGSWWLSAHYYLEDLKLVFGAWSLELAALGFMAWILDRSLHLRRSAMLLFLVPLLFYTQSFAYGSVPIYVPTLFPHTYYNLRYGLEMAPAVALLAAFLIPERASKNNRRVLLGAICAILAVQAIGMGWRGAKNLAVVREGVLNTPCKSDAEQDVIQFFRNHYDGQPVLLAAGEWPCLMPRVGIPYRKTLTNVDRKYWRKIHLGAARYVGWIIREKSDPVDELMKAFPQAFRDFEVVSQKTFPRGTYVEIYRRAD
jgi:hypothetical protein